MGRSRRPSSGNQCVEEQGYGVPITIGWWWDVGTTQKWKKASGGGHGAKKKCETAIQKRMEIKNGRNETKNIELTSFPPNTSLS